MSSPERHLDDATCADLVLGLLPREESEPLLAHSERCPECEARLRAHAGAAARAMAEAATLAGEGREGAPPLELVPPVRRRWPWLATGIAAAAALALLVVPRLMTPPEPPPVTRWLETPDEIVQLRAEGTLPPQLVEGLGAYAARDLPRAVHALREAAAEGAAEQARRLYLGHALLAMGEAREAFDWLSRVDREQLPEPWRTQADSALAEAERASGRRAGAGPGMQPK